ncbi:MAG TPA: PAS domain S-box protein [Idiomarina sp.]|nr:PAS domain S-box protein [Idiomarina sp.]
MEIEKTFCEFLEIIPDGALVIDQTGTIVAANMAAATMFDYSSSGLIDLPLDQLIPVEFRQAHAGHLKHFFEHPGKRSMGNGLRFPAVKRSGVTFYVDIMLNQMDVDGALYGVAIVRDYTLQQQAEEKIRRELEFEKRQASTDHLTGVMNRRAFVAQLNEELQQLAEHGTPFAVGFIDLDDFKEVNDKFGHQYGDEVLQAIGKIITSCSRHSDHVARIGGDEFATIHPMISAENAQQMMERLRTQLVSGIASEHLPVTLSIGLCQCDQLSQGHTVESIIDMADKAMYQAKSAGKNAVVLAKPAN